MEQNINNLIDNINDSLAWIKKYKPSDYEQKFFSLIEERRKLGIIKTACKDNPAIAAYGVSQVGKSYLINTILQKDGKPFTLEANGKQYNFIEEMNPKTKNTEATGVVTRFTSFRKNPERYSTEYPILMRCLSISDIILILCDGYYNDISDFTSLSENELEEKGNMILEKYSGNIANSTSPITADDILNIKAYFFKHLNNAQTFIHKASFFDKLALVIDKIPTTDWVSIFSILWNESPYQTKLFSKMLKTLEKVHFSEYVYLPAEALLHDGINENTIMSVQCLSEMFLDTPKYFTDAYFKHNQDFTLVPHLTKSEICAVCAEIIVKIGEDYLEQTSAYCLDNIEDENVKAALTDNNGNAREVRMSLLKENDLLDFPGARSRKKELLCTLEDDIILINVLLRGKVAYLFNKYNESKLINILLYCHHGEKNEVTDVPHMLNEWIRNYVGDTIEKRKRTLDLTGGISPLFYIGTKFNLDMEESTEEIANGINALNGRWQQRFFKTLYSECFNADGSLDAKGTKIFLNWTRPNESFNNSYILRDYKYSGPKASKLYEGEKTENKKMLMPKDYFNNMRKTFCENENVKRFFPNPALSWDVAATIDNDGALYIIEQLSKVAEKMNATRESQFKDILVETREKVLSNIQDYFISTDAGKILDANIRKAKAIFREMDFTCNSDNYYFGHLIHALQVAEQESYKIIHKTMQGPDINSQVNSFKDYEIIRSSCKKGNRPLEEAKSDEEKWQCIIDIYGFKNQIEAEDFLSHKQIDTQKLFSGEYKRKINSCIIADSVYNYWLTKIKSVDFMNEFANEDSFDLIVMGYLVDNLIVTSDAIGLKDKMAESIAEYVNVVDIHTANESLLADILADYINEFILDFGFEYITDEKEQKSKEVCLSHHLPTFNYIMEEQSEECNEEILTSMFNDMSENPKALLPSFEENYNKWMEYMFVSFVAYLNIPDYNEEANNKLEFIINRINEKTAA